MRTTTRIAVGATCALLALTACGNDDEEGGGDAAATSGGGGGGSQSIKIGVLTPLSGPSAATYGDLARSGVEARIAAYEDEGGQCADNDFEIVDADDTSSPAGALAATQRLVQQEGVYAVLSTSSNFFGVAQFATTGAADTVFIGDASDQSPGWREPGNNLFPAQPVPDPEAVYPIVGEYMASLGGTTFGGVAFPVAASQGALNAAVESATAAGLDTGYVNDSFPIGSSDVGPIVLGIEDSGTDALYLPITFDGALSIVQGLEQSGVETAGILAATGYGNDLLASAPAVEAAQGVSFSIGYAPVSSGTEATDRLKAAVQASGVETGIPSYAMTSGWFNADLLLHGLELAGCDASQEEFMTALNEDDTYDGSGLFQNTYDFTLQDQPESCLFFVTLEGEEFVPAGDGSAVCGEKLN
ncbi:ABC transporter substrate-binding protein [Blastococcus sp. URHD0036]|uniref:ABC transporter substrate-binding protein n=1 Tax=Blastococcus sp. URHD0036 TaxID=1380356 RepID=UPI0018CC04AE|nr:ABC transporter substrate-binding protein [Blastococcus sp. URHD0036]